jgi:hypothetical protein
VRSGCWRRAFVLRLMDDAVLNMKQIAFDGRDTAQPPHSWPIATPIRARRRFAHQTRRLPLARTPCSPRVFEDLIPPPRLVRGGWRCGAIITFQHRS